MKTLVARVIARRLGPWMVCFLVCGFVALGASPVTSAKVKPKTPKAAVPGGANQVQGLTGKLGDMLFDGRWRFQAISITPVTSYTMTVPRSEQDYALWHDVAEYDDASHTFTPKAGYTFFAVKCRVKNGQKQTEQLDCYSDSPKTALTDAGENSFPPFAYDMYTSSPLTTKAMLPGSGADITVLFAVDSTTKPQSMVFTLKNWSSHTGNNVRVKLN
ncbi:MAG TPA: hypothetical protein VGK19_11835 [Capsulimonadaceae bacterium]|jgi:hypothetical protein